MTNKQTRRDFLQGAPCAALGSSAIMSTLLNLKMANNAVAASLPLDGGSDRKTLVCLFLHGGIDSYNILVPRDDTRYQAYADTRTDIALQQNELLALEQVASGDGQLYGLHPATGSYRDLFNGIDGDQEKRRLSFIANIGTLIQPTTKAQYDDETVPLPRSLFSHSDQTEQWQTSIPQGDTRLTGWAGRMADVLHCTHNQNLTSMSLSFAGNNVFQVGRQTSQFVMNNRGALTFSQDDRDTDHPTFQKNIAVKSLMEQEYSNMMQKAFAELTSKSISEQEFVQDKFDSLEDNFANVTFPNTGIGRDFESALKMIKLRPELGLRRQTIFIGFGGWDHHAELLAPQSDRLSQLAPAVEAFQKGIEELGLEDSVMTFTASDFARTLRSNGGGSDHAWGGNQMVFGGAVDGGKILGEFPDLTFSDSNPIYVSRGGRTLPGVSVDEFFAELLLWFGLKGESNFEQVLPNLSNFFDLSQVNPADPSTFPIGFLKPNTFEV